MEAVLSDKESKVTYITNVFKGDAELFNYFREVKQIEGLRNEDLQERI